MTNKTCYVTTTYSAVNAMCACACRIVARAAVHYTTLLSTCRRRTILSDIPTHACVLRSMLLLLYLVRHYSLLLLLSVRRVLGPRSHSRL